MCVCMYIHVLTVPVADPVGDDDDVACLIGSHNFRGKTVDITRGDYSDLMKRLVDNLQLAKVRIALYAGTVMRPYTITCVCYVDRLCPFWLLKYLY